MQQFAGNIDHPAQNVVYEVYVDFDEYGKPVHVYVIIGRTQITDFPFNSPNNDELSQLAQKLVFEKLSTVEFSTPAEEDAFEVIDTEDII